MVEPADPDDAPRRPYKEYEDPHFHDEDEVTPPAVDDQPRPSAPRNPSPPSRKLPPPPRRFYED
ncbi:MAG: hypothetical protein U0840_12890 [Gemmataceae bacterium]